MVAVRAEDSGFFPHSASHMYVDEHLQQLFGDDPSKMIRRALTAMGRADETLICTQMKCEGFLEIYRRSI